MPTCVVPGCRSGYKPTKAEQNDHEVKTEKLHWHKFPEDNERLSVWKNKIPRKEITESNSAYALGEAKCNKGHIFRPFISKIARCLFNIMAKNITAHKNDEIHHSRKRKGSDPKSSSAARKILKLNSSC